MSLLDALILAVVQGATEFLPVSSSAHIALVGRLVGVESASIPFVVTIHLGTLVAVLIYYRADLLAILRSLWARPEPGTEEHTSVAAHRRLLVALIVGTIPAAVAGVLLEDYVEAAFGSTRMVGVCLLITASLLFIVTRRNGSLGLEQTGWRAGLIVGCWQAVALLPGVSRSGATIVGGLLTGFSRDWAPRFAFLLSVPVILGGGLFEALKLFSEGFTDTIDPVVYALSLVVSSVVGYASILLVTDSVRRGNLLYYAAYCALVGVAAIVLGSVATG